MNEKQFFEEIGRVDDDLVEEAMSIKKRRPRVWLRWTAAAACVCICVAGALIWKNMDKPSAEPPASKPALEGPAESAPPASGAETPPTETPPTETPPVETPAPELPKISLESAVTEPDGMGFEGYMVYDISELEHSSPIEPDEIPETLPVFKNAVFNGVDTDALLAELKLCAERLGVEFSEERLEYDLLPEEVRESMLASGNKYAVAMTYYDNSVTLSFDGGSICSTPSGVSVRLDGEGVSTEGGRAEAEREAQYLFDLAPALFSDMEQPAPDTESWGRGTEFSYDEAGNIAGISRIYESLHTYWYDASGSPTEQLLSRCLNSVSGAVAGGAAYYTLKRTDLTGKLGDYPTITLEEATEELRAGNYITTADYDFNADDIAKAEIIYRSDRSEILIPYYRFYVEIDDSDMGYKRYEPELKTYLAVYVPAIAPEYIDSAGVWDGSFN